MCLGFCECLPVLEAAVGGGSALLRVYFTSDADVSMGSYVH